MGGTTTSKGAVILGIGPAMHSGDFPASEWDTTSIQPTMDFVMPFEYTYIHARSWAVYGQYLSIELLGPYLFSSAATIYDSDQLFMQ